MSAPAIVDLSGVLWWAPHVPGKGWPIFPDPDQRLDRRCVAAFTTIAAARAAIPWLFEPAGIELHRVEASAFIRKRAERDLTVIVDLELRGDGSAFYQLFPPVFLSIGGDA